MLEYPTKCPDTYGLKASHESSLKKAAERHFKKVPSFMPIMSTLFCAGALFFLYLIKEIKYSAKTKSIDTSGPEPLLELPLILQAAESFSRTATALSLRAQSFQEKLIDYAEAEKNDEDYQTGDSYDDAAYVPSAAPPVEGQPTTEPEPTPAQAHMEEMQKYKRPLFARFTKLLFRKRSKKIAPRATF
jgi:hypothetical protein